MGSEPWVQEDCLELGDFLEVQRLRLSVLNVRHASLIPSQRIKITLAKKLN